MKLYSYYRSACSYRVRIALNVKALSYDYHPVHLVRNGGEQNTPEYKAVNPQALVPSLAEDGFILTQSLAMLEYLEEQHPEPAILPKGARERAYVRQIALVSASDIHPYTNLKALNYLSGELGVTQAQKNAWVQHWVSTGLEATEKLLERSPFRTGPYVCGDAPSLADICLVPQVYAARRFEVALDRFPLVSAIDAACLKLKTFADAAPENQPDTPEDQRPAFLKGKN
jgi:maleylacetoacetate isomerase